jgi:hydrogenase-4 component B
VMVFIALSASLAVFSVHRFASRALRREPAWGCGFSDATPAAQYSGESFAQPIRRVFGTLMFHARDHVTMPAPGDTRPARLRIELHDLIWERMYQPIAGAIAATSERLNRLQFLTIRQYLGLVFATLVTLLLALAIWS